MGDISSIFDEKLIESIPDKVCCCCGHSLDNHVDEREGWRCHSLGQDWYQCECYLRKNRYDSISGYDLKLRIKETSKEEAKPKLYGAKK